MYSVERRATAIAGFTAFSLAIAKLIAGVFTGSMAVISGAIDSLLDMAMSLFNLYAAKTGERLPDEEFNYGRGKIAGLAALAEGVLIAASAAFIVFQSARNMISGEPVSNLGAAGFVMALSIAVTSALVFYLSKLAKISDSLIIKSDLTHYKSDLWTNIGIIASIGAIHLTGWHFVDGIVSIAIAAFISAGAFKIAREGVLTLMDHAIEEPLLSRIAEVIQNAPELQSYHYLRTRRCANTYIVDCHLVFNETISLKDAHSSSDWAEAAVAALKPEARWIITFHLDPINDS